MTIISDEQEERLENKIINQDHIKVLEIRPKKKKKLLKVFRMQSNQQNI